MRKFVKQLLIGLCSMVLLVPVAFAGAGLSVHLGPSSYNYHDRGGPAVRFGLHYNTAPYHHHSRYHYRPYHYYQTHRYYQHHRMYKPYRTYYHKHYYNKHRPYGHYKRPFYGRTQYHPHR